MEENQQVGPSREEILEKARELARFIADSSEVDIYRRAESQIAVNTHVQSLISTIKKKQKEAVAFEHSYRNPQMSKKIDEEISLLQEELDSIPIVAEFQETQSELNDMLQLVMNAVRDTVSEQIQVEEGKIETTRCD
ncbi:MAG: hypothetical protein K0R57_5963 [Paenibacillaceae bacterium]|jgi:cell fate (sporulation/competence/biofilm development) regulator YmcA (YheA/YmcA/DUF963 family)|nr:hypothetical protein [Paenibacillaceae bacterium]